MDAKMFRLPVHRSLLQRDLVMGIPSSGLMMLLIGGIFFIYVFRQYWTLAVFVVLYIVMRALTKKDPYYVDILLQHLGQKDHLIP